MIMGCKLIINIPYIELLILFNIFFVKIIENISDSIKLCHWSYDAWFFDYINILLKLWIFSWYQRYIILILSTLPLIFSFLLLIFRPMIILVIGIIIVIPVWNHGLIHIIVFIVVVIIREERFFHFFIENIAFAYLILLWRVL